MSLEADEPAELPHPSANSDALPVDDAADDAVESAWFDSPFHRAVAITGLTALAFLLRLVTAGFVNRPTGNGALHYLPGIEPFADGRWVDAYQVAVPPLYSALGALLLPWTGDAEHAGQLLTVLAGTALVPISAWLASRVAGPLAALVTASLVAVSSSQVIFSAITEVEVLYSFFVILSVALGVELWRNIDRTRAWPVAAAVGMATGLATQCRPEGIGVALVALAGLPFVGERSVVRRLGLGVALLIFWTVPQVPYALYLRETTGQLHFSGKLNQHLLELHDPLELRPDLEMTWFEYTLDPANFEAADPLDRSLDVTSLVGDWATRLGKLLKKTPRYLDFAPLLGVFLAIVFARRGTRYFRWPLAVLGFYVAVCPLFLSTWRLWIPYVPLFALVSGVGFTALYARNSRWGSLAVEVGLALALVLGGVRVYKEIRDRGLTWQDSPERRLGAWIAERDPSPKLVEWTNGVVFHYAEGQHLVYPKAEADGAFRHFEIRGEPWIVIDTDKRDLGAFPWMAALEDHSVYRLVRREVEPVTERELLLYGPR